jgi:hypothetical protein
MILLGCSTHLLLRKVEMRLLCIARVLYNNWAYFALEVFDARRKINLSIPKLYSDERRSSLKFFGFSNDVYEVPGLIHDTHFHSRLPMRAEGRFKRGDAKNAESMIRMDGPFFDSEAGHLQ